MEDSKKRKLEETGNGEIASNASEEHLRSLLYPLAKSHLVHLLSKLGSQYPSIAEEIKSVASADPANRKLFVRGLAWNTTSKTLCAAFIEHGEIEEGAVITDKASGKSLGYGFITYRDIDSARKAFEVPSKLIDGRMAVCTLACEDVSSTSLIDQAQRKFYIGGLSPDPETTSEMLLSFFKKHRKIEEGSVAYDKDTNESLIAEAAKKASDDPQMSGFFLPNVGRTSSPSIENPLTPSTENLLSPLLGSNNLDEEEVEKVSNEGARTLWSLEEDTLLISAWLNISKNPITGTDQKGESFWKRIAKYCHENQPGSIKRNFNAIQKHWAKLNKFVSVYSVCWEKTSQRHVSGYSEIDYIDETQKMFEDMYPKCKVDVRKRWLLLANEEKWKCHVKQSGGSKWIKTTQTGVYASSSNSEYVQPNDTDSNVCVPLVEVKMAEKESKNKDDAQQSIVTEELQGLKKSDDEANGSMKMMAIALQDASDSQVIYADTSLMSPSQLRAHEIRMAEVLKRLETRNM